MILEVRNLSKIFHQGDTKVEVFSNLNLDIKESEVIAVLGPSGSGKSTLLSLVAGLDRATSGEIIFLGKDICKLSEEELTRFRADNVGIVFQQYHLFPHLTALENVSIALELLGRDQPTENARKALADVGLSHRLDHFPSQLSGGECQRVAIARAMVLKPRILLADEPSGSLDTETGDQVMSLLFELVRKNKMTMLLITHNDELAKRADRIFRFQ